MDYQEKTPRIGVPYRTRKEEVTSGTDKIEKYLMAVRRAGGQPVPISLAASSDSLARLASSLDGIVLSGSRRR